MQKLSRLSDLGVLYTSQPRDKQIVEFDSIQPPCRLLDLMTIQDINELHRIAKSAKLSSKPRQKKGMIKKIMEARGFKQMSAGTNRLVFKYMENQSFVVKVAFDRVGLGDNLCELYNQELIKPFCCKVFDVSPCGTVGMFERVRPILNRKEFASVAGDIFDILVGKFIGKYVLADFGTKYFMNWGLRDGMHPVILDYPYIYEIDGARIFCNRPDSHSLHGFCGGEIDYDEGLNRLICTKCGKTYTASELKLAVDKKSKDLIVEKEDIDMIVQIYKGDELIATNDTTKESTNYKLDKKGRKKETPLEYRERKKYEGFSVEIITVEESSNDNDEEKTVTDTIETSNNAVNENDFNKNYSLADVPEVDDMYRDMNIDVIGRKGKQVIGKNGDNIAVEKQKEQPMSNYYNCDIAQEIIEKRNQEPEITPVKTYQEPVTDTVEEQPTENEEEPAIQNNAPDISGLANAMMVNNSEDENITYSESDIVNDNDANDADNLVEILSRCDMETKNDITVDSEFITEMPPKGNIEPEDDNGTDKAIKTHPRRRHRRDIDYDICSNNDEISVDPAFF